MEILIGGDDGVEFSSIDDQSDDDDSWLRLSMETD